jgi:hypothetical protein
MERIRKLGARILSEIPVLGGDFNDGGEVRQNIPKSLEFHSTSLTFSSVTH